MGGKKRTGSAGKAPKVEVDPEVRSRASAEGDGPASEARRRRGPPTHSFLFLFFPRRPRAWRQPSAPDARQQPPSLRRARLAVPQRDVQMAPPLGEQEPAPRRVARTATAARFCGRRRPARTGGGGQIAALSWPSATPSQPAQPLLPLSSNPSSTPTQTQTKTNPKTKQNKNQKQVAAKAHETKAEGDKLFVKKEFAKAMEAYASAAGMLPEGAAERAELLGAKAACLYAQRRWRDSARECSAALAVPGAGAAGAKALLRRAHCYEHLALYKQALADAQAYNRTELSTEESKRLEQRLRTALQGGAARGPSLARGGANASAQQQAAAAARAYQQQQQQAQAQQQQRPPPGPTFLAAKVVLQGAAGAEEEEARLVQMPAAAASYATLRSAVATKFGSLLENKPFLLKYKDTSGAPVTITCREDIAQATTALLANNPEATRRLALTGGVAPPFDVTVVPVEDASAVPPVPEDEEKARELFARHERLQLARELKRQAAIEAALDKEEAEQQQQQAQQQQQQEVQLDDWLLEFADIFRDMSQLDADAHAESLNEGWELTHRAMAATLRCDAALPLFAKAQDRFAEVTAVGLVQWGNVHTNIAHKLAEDAAPAAAEAARAAGVADTNEARAKVAKPALAAATKKAGAELDAAEKRYQEALKYKPDFFDALSAMGQLEFDRAKLRAGLVVVTPVPGAGAAAAESNDNADENNAEAKSGGAAEVTPAAAEALREALRRVAPGDVSAAKKHYDAAAKWFDKARQCGAAADARRVAEAGEAAAAREGGAAAAAAEEAGAQQLSPEASVESQALIMAGNVAYEWSQLLAAVAGDAPGSKGAAEAGKAWRAALDDATARFREAKCSEADVRAALKNHTRAADLDLGPEPEPEAVTPITTPREEEKAAAAAEQPKPAAKGLPSLEVKGKKKADAAAAAKA
jgi:hypothetical protein